MCLKQNSPCNNVIYVSSHSSSRFPIANDHYWRLTLRVSLGRLASRLVCPCTVLDTSGHRHCAHFSGSTKKKRGPFSSHTNTIGQALSVRHDSLTFKANIRPISSSSSSHSFGQDRYRFEYSGRPSELLSSVWCCSTIIEPRWSSHILSNCSSMLLPVHQYGEQSYGTVRSSSTSALELSPDFSRRYADPLVHLGPQVACRWWHL